MFRPLTADPKPCSRCWVTLRVKLEAIDGLRLVLRLVVLRLELLRPTVNDVPVRNPWEYEKLAKLLLVTRTLVPLTKALVCGLLACPRRINPVTTGSRLGIAVPV